MGLTKEEKKALKLAKKLEKAKKAAEEAKTRKIDELERELAAHELNRLELQTKMNHMMVTAKEPVYRQNVQAMEAIFNRTFDKKNHLIDHLIYLRRIADDQYCRTITAFCVIVDDIISTFLNDLDEMCKETQRKTDALVLQGQKETEYIIEYQKNGEQHLSILLYHSHELADSLAWTIKGENFVRLDEDTTNYVNIRDDLSAILEGLFTAMWEEYRGTLKGYVTGTFDNQKQVRILRKKDAAMSDIIAAQAKKIYASEGIIKRLRNELIAYESGTKQAGFRDRRKRHKEACSRLKHYFYQGMKIDEKKIDILVTTSNDSIAYLEKACKKSERILRIAALCRKLETQHEKVFPFGTTTIFEPAEPETNTKTRRRRRSLNKMTSEDSLVANAISATCGLTKLWQRISTAELSRRALYREKSLLEQENAELMHILNMRSQETPNPETVQCTCIPTRTGKRSVVRPNAVEGSLEVKKLIRN